MVGRFNPPTAGHYRVMDKMKQLLSKKSTRHFEPVIVIIHGKETGKDKSKNPLSLSDRESFIKASGNADGFTILSASNAFEAFAECRKNGFEPITIAAGSDRAQHYVELLDEYYPSHPDGSPIKHNKLTGLTRSKTNDNSVEGVSATLARQLAQDGNEEDFIKVVGLEHKPKLGKMLFNKVVKALDGKGNNNESI